MIGDLNVLEKTLDGERVIGTFVHVAEDPDIFCFTKVWAHPALRGKDNYRRFMALFNDDIMAMLGDSGCVGGYMNYTLKGTFEERRDQIYSIVADSFDRGIICQDVVIANQNNKPMTTAFMYCFTPADQDWETIPPDVIDKFLTAHGNGRAYRG